MKYLVIILILISFKISAQEITIKDMLTQLTQELLGYMRNNIMK